MSTDSHCSFAGKQPPTLLVARLASILRGLLARQTANEDDPWERVVLHGEVTTGGPELERGRTVLTLSLPADTANLDTLRTSILQGIRQYESQHGIRPTCIVFEGVQAFTVEAESSQEHRPLTNKVALVTGAAGAIGWGICRGLLQHGCHVAAADVDERRLDNLVAELAEESGRRVMGLKMDVTDSESVRCGFDRVACTWGGVDIVVANAGIAMVCSLAEMDIEGFRRLERVNVEGTLLTLSEAARRLQLQGTGGDIILISTKNVFSPGASFGAYSATKAAAHQLARVASIELAPFGIRVNMVAPDAVFGEGAHRSGLWAEIGPVRMRARGLDEKELEEYYRNRNLLKARIRPDHVAKAVLFFATRQTPTTGATLPVDGGLPDAAPR